jgi:carboxylesterase type B
MNGYQPFEIDHPVLGRLIGTRRNDQVIQFRSIPFGFIPRRFRQAVLVEQLSSKQRTCTDYSYACPQEEQSMDAFGGPIPGEQARQYDELSCLNLTVTAPASLLSPGSTRKVPVLVYVHGGGFTVGAHFGGPHGQ